MLNLPYGYTVTVNNVNEALPRGMQLLQEQGVKSESRGLQTIRVPGPVSTVYRKPMERVLFDPIRDANPFFHLMESLWIIGGSERVELPAYFLKSITNYSDNGTTFHGAYGYRLRHNFGFDQIELAVATLTAKPDTRQCVLSIWDPLRDLANDTKDIPCNDLVMLDIVDGRLNMTVCNRSNDVVWGAYGANAVQFSMLQEHIAARVGVPVGFYVQQSNNYHVYTDNPAWLKFLGGEYTHGHVRNEYMGDLSPWPMAKTPADAATVAKDCRVLCGRAESRNSLLSPGLYSSLFFHHVVEPVIHGYDMYKSGHLEEAMAFIFYNVAAEDWSVAMCQWIQRRIDRKAA